MGTEHQGSSADQPGSMTLFDAYRPGIQSGGYRFVLQQTIAIPEAKETEKAKESHHYYRDQRFIVQGPRFSIGRDEIHAFFPPDGITGAFQKVLPHVVLRKRALPWERPIDGIASSAPWLTLLVLSRSDLELAGGDTALKTVKPLSLVSPEQLEPGELHALPGGILLPELSLETETKEDKLDVQVIDLPLKRFLELCPQLEDLPYLAHLRCVDTSDKVSLGMHADGQFSVLVGGRFPQEGANIALIVSLEGWGSLLADKRRYGGATIQRSSASEALKVRLVVLGSWRFVSDPTNVFTFKRLITHLEPASFGVTPERAVKGAVADALKLGYVPLEYRPLRSTPTFAWYRGPLAPLQTTSFGEVLESLRRADDALIVDEKTGILDVSYASAWQLGRMLALASPSFSSGFRAFVEEVHSIGEAARRLEAFLELHQTEVEEAIGDAREREAAARARAEEAGRQTRAEEAKSRAAIAIDLVEWLARLVLLYPVPFDYLVADPKLLPNESLRFFYVDNNWVEALVAGALSIGLRNAPGDRATRRQVDGRRNEMHRSIAKMVYQYRRLSRGKNVSDAPPDDFLDRPRSGFLIRSAAVTGWPGLEVSVETASNEGDSSTAPTVLRLDRLSDDVILCMVHGRLKSVTFKEPPEGLIFGYGGSSKLDGSNSRFPARTPLRTDMAHGMLNVRSLAITLAGSDGNTVPGVVDDPGKAPTGAAAFARHMILTPVVQTIHWTPSPQAPGGLEP